MKKLIALMIGAMMIMPAMAADEVITTAGDTDIDVDVTIDPYFQVTVYGGLTISLGLDALHDWYDASHVTVGVKSNVLVDLTIDDNNAGLFDPAASLWDPAEDVAYGFTDGDGEDDAYVFGVYEWLDVYGGSAGKTKNIAVEFQGSLDIPANTNLDGQITLTVG